VLCLSQEGLSTFTTRAMNAEHLDLLDNQYDAVISQFGLMLIKRGPQALLEIRCVLKPGGRMATIVWSKPERNPLFVLPDTMVAKFLGAQGPEKVWGDPFSLADAALFASRLTQNGCWSQR
jgi:ubiquinone/menaquinone biosynthesis C-methylase UbiE